MRSAITRGGAVQLLHALDHQAVGADAVDLRAHLHQQVGQVGHFRLARGVFQHGLAFGQAAAISRFSVPVTVIMSVTMRAPFRRLALAWM
jgi:hypothetical protein